MGAVAIAESPDVLEFEEGNKPGGLTPFNSESARIAAAKSAATRRAQAEARKAAKRTTAQTLARLRSTYDRDDLGEFSALMVMETMSRVLTGQIELRNGSEAAAFIRECHQIYRLESGQSTSNSVSLSGNAEAVLSRLDQARQGIGNPTPEADGNDA